MLDHLRRSHRCLGWVTAVAVTVLLPRMVAAQPAAAAIDSPFRLVDPSKPAAGSVPLSFREADYLPLRQAYEQRTNVSLRGFHLPGRQVDLRLQPINVVSDAFTAEVVDANGSRVVAPRVATFRGFIEGSKSYVFLAISPDRAHGYVLEEGDRTWILSSGDPRGPGGSVFISDAKLVLGRADADPWICQVLDLEHPDLGGPPTETGLHVEGTQVRISDMFIDADHQFRGLFDTA